MLVQMNTRIDDDVKRCGDEVFAESGYSPSQVVRAIWGFAAKHRADPTMVARLLATLEGRDADHALSRAEKIRQSASLVDRLLEEQGLTPVAAPDPLPYDELRERALAERQAERGL